MRIHIICSISGSLNEGVNNIATHYIRLFEKKNRITRSSIKTSVFHLRQIKNSDFVMIFARLNSLTYHFARLISRLNKKLFIMVCQPCEYGFAKSFNRKAFSCYFFCLDTSDVKLISNRLLENRVFSFSIGLDFNKFNSVNQTKQILLKEKYGFNPSKKVILHVGHCTKGRGLLSFLNLRYKNSIRVFIDSDIYKDDEILKKLQNDGVVVIKGYQPNIEEFFQLADLYFFPTLDTSFVVSQPLSVFEALSCGTPVILYKEFSCLFNNRFVDKNGIHLINNRLINDDAIFSFKNYCKGYIDEKLTWDSVSNACLSTIKDIIYEN